MDDSIKEAIRYIGIKLKDEPDTNKSHLIDEASQKFDLNPMQTEFLTNKYLLGK